jgi:hypothetical protein
VLVSLRYTDVVRALAVLLGLTACYRPGAEVPCTVQCGAAQECPGGLVCNTATNQCALVGGGCSVDAPPGTIDSPFDSPFDSPIDSPIDAVPIIPCVISPAPPGSTRLLAGDWYIAERAAPRAVMIAAGDILETSLPDTMNANDYSLVYPLAPTGIYSAPRLAPGGDELFLVMKMGSNAMARATRNAVGNTWSAPVPMIMKQSDGVTDAIFVDGHVPSAPTTTNPRRMLVSLSTIDEYRETAPNEWRRIASYPATIGGISVLGHALLSPDGRRMTFRGQLGSSIVAGYFVERASLSSAFGTIPVQIPTSDGLSVATPYLTPDCKHYYYADPNGGYIHHVVYP